MNEKSRRIQRVEKEIHQVVSQYLVQDMKGLTTSFPSVTRVIASADLRHAKVFIHGLQGDSAEDLLALQDHGGEIQQKINKTIRMKYCPKLAFFIDPSFSQRLDFDKKLEEISKAMGSTQEGTSVGDGHGDDLGDKNGDQNHNDNQESES